MSTTPALLIQRDVARPDVRNQDVVWVDGKPAKIRVAGDWMRVTPTARPYRYRDRSPDSADWCRGVHCFKKRERRDRFMRGDIASGRVVQPYDITEDGPLYGLVLKSRTAILHSASRSRFFSKQVSAGIVSIKDRAKTWCAEHRQHGCGPDCVAEFEQYGDWDHSLDPFRLGWQPYCRLDDKPEPPRKVQTAVGEMTIFGVLGVPRIRCAKAENQ